MTIIEDTLGIWSARKLTEDLLVGMGMLEMAANLAGSGFTPTALIIVPKYFTVLATVVHSLPLCKTFCNYISCSLIVSAAMMISSATMYIPSILAKAVSFFETLQQQRLN